MRRFIFAIFSILFLVAPAYPLTVEEAVQRALTHNPDLQALRLEEDAAGGRLEKAQLLLISNPTVEGNVSKKDKPEEEGGGAFTNYGFKLSQEFEVAGQRSARIKMAEKDFARVKAEIKDKERVLIADVKDAFTKVLASKKKSGLAQEIVQLKEELRGYTKIKFQAGEISGLDLNLSEVELSKAKRELLLSEREYREALLVLQGFIGLSPDRSFAVQGDLPSEAPVLPDKEILKEALARRPDAQASVFEVERTLSSLKLAKKEVVPNITLAGFYDRDEMRNAVGIEMSIPLPLFDRKQAEKKEAYAKAEGARIKSEGLKKTIEREVEQVFNDLSTAIEELSIFKKEIIAKAAENLNLLNLAFKEGKVGFFEVRLAQKDTIEAQFAYIEAQAKTQLALIALEKTMGSTEMMKQIRITMKQRLLAAILIILGIAFLVVGCGKKEAAKEGKQAVVEEKKEAGHEGEHEASGVVTLSLEMQKSSGVEVKKVAIEAEAVPLSATAFMEMNMDRAAKISSRVTGKAIKVIASQGDRVKAGQPLAYLDSVELDQIWADYRKAQGRAELARKSLHREEILFQQKISAEKDVLKARQELGEIDADLNLARERFRLIGVDVGQFESVKGNGNYPLVPITSPVGGVVIEKAVTQGEVVNPEKVLFMVADLSTLWVVIDVYEKDISRLRIGAGVKVSVTAFPDKIFRGKVSYIADVVDEKTRTEKARVTIDNSGDLLKPGMFATVLTEARNAGTERLIAVPEEAVQIDGAKRYVFVQVSPDKFKRRDIETGRTLGKRLEVTAGLRVGEAVAVKGAFILKSELKKGELVDEHGH